MIRKHETVILLIGVSINNCEIIIGVITVVIKRAA
jgi:hypothetical protein